MNLIMCTGEKDASEIMKETAAVAAKFYPVGRALGLQPSKLDIIKHNYPRECDEALNDVIVM